MLLAGWVVAARRAGAARADLHSFGDELERRGASTVWAVALAMGALAWACATVSSAGADASGYLSQAAMWARLDWRVIDVLAGSTDWPLPAESTAPLGWRPAREHGWKVPTSAPGLPLLMAVPTALAGNAGASAVVTVSAVLAIGAAGGQWEEAPVRSRFGSRPEGALDWPPLVEGGRVMRTRAWRIGN